ncbi:MAG: type IV-A pilus assembly ATPase PilB [Coxiellaceae bacterium]|nr:type IV-A pilus assembly ATPase PilB [Coxiellaceae bacterium]
MQDLFEQLIAHQICNQDQLEQYHQAAKKSDDKWLSHLLKDDSVNYDKLAEILSSHFGFPLYDLATFDPGYIVQNLLESSVVTSHQGLPLFESSQHIVLAVSDPTLHSLEELEFLSEKDIEIVIVSNPALLAAMSHVQQDDITSLSDLTDDEDDDFDGFDELDFSAYQEDEGKASEVDVNDTPVVKFVNKILLDAIRSSSSDIHIEPYEKTYRVRYRQDGILYEVSQPPLQLSSAIVARLKVMSNLDISERRVPQDGRFKLNLSKQKSVDFRISTCPTLFGEKVVMRILDASAALIDTSHLGFEEKQTKIYLNEIKSSHGMILVTGPTGSGKTVTLYNGLNILNDSEKNISTIEDPVEINVEGINQVQVNVKSGMTFAGALRSFLRQDPDIIMLGEIRDLETAEIAIKAAQTGHLVLSTLHTNSAPETLTRLVNMGVASFNIASSVNLVIAQRLVRKLCQKCKKKVDVPDSALVEAGFTEEEIKEGVEVFQPNGCKECAQGKGYKGRMGIYEMMPITNEMGRLIMDGGNAIQILDLAVSQGMNTLRRSGLNKVKLGLTSMEEVNRVVTL